MSEERKVKPQRGASLGSLVGIDGILRSWIRNQCRFTSCFLNAFMLMVELRMAKMLDLTGCQRSDEYFQQQARQQGFDKEWIKSILDEAMSSDYDHLVATLLDNMEEEDE